VHVRRRRELLLFEKGWRRGSSCVASDREANKENASASEKRIHGGGQGGPAYFLRKSAAMGENLQIPPGRSREGDSKKQTRGLMQDRLVNLVRKSVARRKEENV